LATMQRICAFIGLAAATLSSGCNLYLTGAYNILNEPKYALQERRFVRKARALAKESWERRQRRVSASDSFAEGYIDGYADFLIAGHTTDPRPTPPKDYLKTSFFTPTQLSKIEDYFAGFSAGAIDAEASGLRHRMVIPVVAPISECSNITRNSQRNLGLEYVPESLPLPREAESQGSPSPTATPKTDGH